VLLLLSKQRPVSNNETKKQSKPFFQFQIAATPSRSERSLFRSCWHWHPEKARQIQTQAGTSGVARALRNGMQVSPSIHSVVK